MIAHSRYQAILEALEQQSPLTVAELRKRLGASSATLRRDLTFLEQIGRVVRTHGGVMHPRHGDSELSFDRKSRAALAAKATLAETAAGLARPGQAVFVDAGTTTLETGRRLLAMEGLTVFTNSVPLLQERPAARTRVIALGGEVRTISLALVGAEALQWTQRLRLDVAFLGTSGIDPAVGVTTTELSEAAVKSSVATHSRRVVVIADRSKWGVPASIRYAEWTQVHDLVTDHVPSSAERRALTRAGTKVHLVSIHR